MREFCKQESVILSEFDFFDLKTDCCHRSGVPPIAASTMVQCRRPSEWQTRCGTHPSMTSSLSMMMSSRSTPILPPVFETVVTSNSRYTEEGRFGSSPETIHEKACNLLRLLVANHPFVDTNKRTALNVRSSSTSSTGPGSSTTVN